MSKLKLEKMNRNEKLQLPMLHFLKLISSELPQRCNHRWVSRCAQRAEMYYLEAWMQMLQLVKMDSEVVKLLLQWPN